MISRIFCFFVLLTSFCSTTSLCATCSELTQIEQELNTFLEQQNPKDVIENHAPFVFAFALEKFQTDPSLEAYYTQILPLIHQSVYLLDLTKQRQQQTSELLREYLPLFDELLTARYSEEEMEAFHIDQETLALKKQLITAKQITKDDTALREQIEQELVQLDLDSKGYISQLNEALWAKIESHLVPLPLDSIESSVGHYAPLVGLFPAGLCTLVADAAYRGTLYGASWLSPWYWCEWIDGDPAIDFSYLLKDSRNWSKLGDLANKITLKQDNPSFQWGVSTCTFQDSPLECEHSQWRDWDRKIGNCIEENRARFEKASLLRLYQTPQGRKELTDRLHKLGLNAYRFSLAWSEIEPQEGVYNEALIDMWATLCKHLRDEGITPMVTLHHFSEPKWFHEKGSFEKEENITHFTRFAKKVAPKLTQDYQGKPLVDHICTINEPNIEAFSRYVRGAFSPGITFDFFKGAQFMKTALKAHRDVYTAIKEISPDTQVGIIHQRLDFHATNLFLSPVTRYLSRFVNRTVMYAFKTGTFALEIPFAVPFLMPGLNIREENMNLKTDFVGLQYYVRPLIGQTGSTSYHAPMTAMPFWEDPEGLYEAVIEAYSAFGVPVIVTENGISTLDNTQRNRYNQRALYSLQRAQEKIGKENVLGYYYWCMTNNYEWDMGLDQYFGAYDVDDEGNIAQEPKPGMDTFRDVTHASGEAS